MSRPAVLALVALLLAVTLPAQEPPTSAPAPAPRSPEQLVAVIGDAQVELKDRRAAVMELGRLDDEVVVERLLALYGEPSCTGLRGAIIDALAARGPSSRVRDFVRDRMANEEDFALRSTAVRALRLVDPDWKASYRKILANEGQKQLHANVVFAIAYSDDEGALDFLREILRTKADEFGSLTITYATSRFGIEETYKDFLQPFLRKQSDEQLRYAAITALGRAKDGRFLPALGRHLSRQERQQTAARWLPLLAGLDDPEAFEAMLEMVEKPNPATEKSFVDQADEMKHPRILAWFRDRGARHKEAMMRLAAIASMRAFPDDKNPKLLEKLAGSDEPEVAARAIGALARQSRALAEPMLRTLYERGSVDQAADALDACAELCGEDEGYAAELIEIARESRTWELRVVAMRRLAEKRAAQAREILLANALHERGAVRMAAYDALTYIRDREIVDFLIGRLEKEDGRPLGELVAALTNLTGTQWGWRKERWQDWWPKVRAEFPLPPRPERTVIVNADDDRRYGFYGIPVDSLRVAFVIDVSSSMTARSRTGTTDRLYQAKNELKSALERFGDRHAFDIVAFNHAPRSYAGKLVPATKAELDRARAWVDALAATGGTNIYDSLELALDLPEVDTIFLLSDGAPGSGKYVDTDLILEAIRRKNRFRRIRINAIGIGVAGETRRLVEELARENWGVSVIL